MAPTPHRDLGSLLPLGPAFPGLWFGAEEPKREVTGGGTSPSMKCVGVAGRSTGAGLKRRCLGRDAAVDRWCCLLAFRMAGLRVDFGLLLEPLGFVKVLEWVSKAGTAQGETWKRRRNSSTSPCWAVSSPFPRLAFFLCLSWVGLKKVCADGLPAPWLVLLVVDVQHKAALQPIPLAGREENSSADTKKSMC